MVQRLARQRATAAKFWLTLGIGIKRWLLLLGVGAAMAGMGVVYIIILLERADFIPEWLYDWLTLQMLPPEARAVAMLAAGVTVIFVSLVRLGSTLVAPFRRPDESLAHSLYRYRQRRSGPHVVAIGGGTGLPSLLRGLVHYTDNITAIVTVADDGGSSGRLRRELGMLPPGDLRNNMAALSRDEALLTQLFQYRFGGDAETGGGELSGHSFGNLLLAALTGITGSFDAALLAAERVLSMQGRVMPSTLAEVTLVADVYHPVDGRLERVVGESAIPQSAGRIKRIALEPSDALPYPPAIKAILQADLVVLGPGSLFTSIIPNLLVPDIGQALAATRAPKVYIANLATQPGETDNYGVGEHVDAILQYISPGKLDAILANDNMSPPPEAGGGRTVLVQPIPPQVDALFVTADLVELARPWRHDSEKLALAIMHLLSRLS